MSFHKGRTERLIGGAVTPNMNAVIKIDLLVSIVLSNRMSAEYIGTKIRIGHFWPNLSITEPRSPAVIEPAREFKPIANPAIAIEPVSCSALKKIPRPIIP